MMNKRELTDYCCGMLEKLPVTCGRGEEYRRCYYECMRRTLESGYSERAFADIWYNAMLWYEASHRLSA